MSKQILEFLFNNKGNSHGGKVIKSIRTESYQIFFNTENGQEILTGINGFPDPFVLEFPSMMDVGVMGHCRNNCKFCYQGNTYQENMDISDFKRIVDEAKSETMQFALGGRGDPDLHENFKELIEYSREYNIVPNYTTSGIGLSDYSIEVSKNCGAVAVSDYDTEATYSAIKRLMDAGIKTNIHFVLTKNSFHRAFNILNGVDVWNGKVDLDRLNAVVFLLFKPQGCGKNLKWWSPLDYQIEWLFKYMRMTQDIVKFKIGMDSCLVNRIKQVESLTASEEIILDTCEGARMSTYVTPDMRLVSCSFGDYVNNGVSIRDRSIKDVWTNSQPFAEFREQLKQCPNSCPFGL